jgi:hypothetical protein
MTAKIAEPASTPSPIDIAMGRARDLQWTLYDFSEDAKTLAWAAEQLWHHEFRGDSPDRNEGLSRFPVVLTRLISSRLEQISEDANLLYPNDGPDYKSAEKWLSDVQRKVKER